jgi:nucleoside 2-deoxyribosyltransferase
VLRQSSDAGNAQTIERENIDSFIRNARYPHDPLATMDELLLLIYKRTNTADLRIKYNPTNDCSLVYAKTPFEFGYLVKMLEEQGYLKETNVELNSTRLSVKGWEKVRELERMRPERGNDAFMATPFSKGDLEDVYHQYLVPAIKKTGFDLKRVNEEQPAGLIDDQLRVRIQNSRFLLAELTTDRGKENGGVYWEAGYAEGLGIPVIYLCRKGPGKHIKTHFDTNHHVTVFWNKETLPQAMDELKATVRYTFPAEAKMTDDVQTGDR